MSPEKGIRLKDLRLTDRSAVMRRPRQMWNNVPPARERELTAHLAGCQ